MNLFRFERALSHFIVLGTKSRTLICKMDARVNEFNILEYL